MEEFDLNDDEIKVFKNSRSDNSHVDIKINSKGETIIKVSQIVKHKIKLNDEE